jgi:hypothetical protein
MLKREVEFAKIPDLQTYSGGCYLKSSKFCASILYILVSRKENKKIH